MGKPMNSDKLSVLPSPFRDSENLLYTSQEPFSTKFIERGRRQSEPLWDTPRFNRPLGPCCEVVYRAWGAVCTSQTVLKEHVIRLLYQTKSSVNLIYSATGLLTVIMTRPGRSIQSECH